MGSAPEEHEKLRKLLARADAEEGLAEGENARRIAERKLSELGLTREDVEICERLILGNDRELWEDALLNLITISMGCDLIERYPSETETVLVIAGAQNLVDRVARLFNTIRTAINNDAHLYDKRTATRIDFNLKKASRFAFCGFAILGIATAWETNLPHKETPPAQKGPSKEAATKIAYGAFHGKRASRNPHKNPHKNPYKNPGCYSESEAQPNTSSNEDSSNEDSFNENREDSLDTLGLQLDKTMGVQYRTSPDPAPNKAGYEAGLLIGDEFKPSDFNGLKRLTAQT